MADTSPSSPDKYEDVEVENKRETKGTGHRLSPSTSSFITTPSGILMIINWILLLLAWSLFASWVRLFQDNWRFADYFGNGRAVLFLISTVTPWLIITVLFVLFAFGIHKRKTCINWPLTMAINCSFWALCLLIANNISIATIGPRPRYNFHYLGHLRAAIVFGNLSMIGLFVQGVLHLLEFIKVDTNMADTSPLSPPQDDNVDVDSKQETKETRPKLSLSTFSFAITPSGILMITNWILLLLAWSLFATWKTHEYSWYVSEYFGNGRAVFFLISTVTPWLIFIVLFVIYALGIHKRKTCINWPLTMAINCSFWALCLLIANNLSTEKIGDYDYRCLGHLRAAIVFGNLSMIGLFVQGVLHYFEFRKVDINMVLSPLHRWTRLKRSSSTFPPHDCWTRFKLSLSTFSFGITPSSILMITNWILLLIAWILFANWAKLENNVDIKKKFGRDVIYYHKGEYGIFDKGVFYYNREIGTVNKEIFFLYATVIPCLIFTALFVIYAFGIHKRKTCINWPLTMAINCGIWAVCLLISKYFIVERIGRTGFDRFDYYFYLGHLRTVLVFGDLSMAGLFVQGVLHLLEFRKQR